MGLMSVRTTGIQHADRTLDNLSGAKLHSRLRVGTLKAATILKRAIEDDAPVGDPRLDPNSGKLRGEVRIRAVRHVQQGAVGYVVGPVSPEKNESIKIGAVVYGRRGGIHGTTQPNPFVDRAERKVHARVVRTVGDAALDKGGG